MIPDRDALPDADRVRRLIFDAVAVNALRQVLAVAAEVGACVAPVKGVVLARWLYDQVADRPYRDVDLLIDRFDLRRMRDAVAARGWTIRQYSDEMGELELDLDRLVVELHAEFGRRDLSELTTGEIIRRSTTDDKTFAFEVNRIDEIDHFLLLIANVTKKAFTYANPHQPTDLQRLLARLCPREQELVTRAQEAGFLTALRNAAVWMADEFQSDEFRRLVGRLPGPGRPLFSAAVRLQRRLAQRRSDRLHSLSGLLGLALATATPDRARRRASGVARLIRRGALRRMHFDPG